MVLQNKILINLQATSEAMPLFQTVLVTVAECTDSGAILTKPFELASPRLASMSISSNITVVELCYIVVDHASDAFDMTD